MKEWGGRLRTDKLAAAMMMEGSDKDVLWPQKVGVTESQGPVSDPNANPCPTGRISEHLGVTGPSLEINLCGVGAAPSRGFWEIQSSKRKIGVFCKSEQPSSCRV